MSSVARPLGWARRVNPSARPMRCMWTSTGTRSCAGRTAVQPPGRFGASSLQKDQNRVDSFKEKPQGDGAWVNGQTLRANGGMV